MAVISARRMEPESAGTMFGDATEEQRVAYMKSLGATNLDPPLVHSTHLRIKKTGRVLPWNELLAEQTTLVENCDAFGNTDPMAWMPTVKPEGETSSEDMNHWAQSVVLSQASQMTGDFRRADAPVMTARPLDMPNSAVAFDDTGIPSNQPMPQEISDAIDKMVNDL